MSVKIEFATSINFGEIGMVSKDLKRRADSLALFFVPFILRGHIEIAWQCQEGLLSRLEADVFDILAATGSISSVNSSSDENEQAEKGNE